MTKKKTAKRKTAKKKRTTTNGNAKQVSELEAILKNVAAPMFVTDKDLTITRINDAALKATGYARDEVVGKMTCAELSKTPLCGTADCTIKNCMKTGEPIHGQTVMKTRDGTEVPIQASCSAIFDKDGNPCGGLEVIVDRSAAVKTQWESDNILKSVGAPMFVTDENLVIQQINDMALKASGYTREEVVGKMTCAELARTPLCGTADCTIKNCMRTGEVINGETVMKTKDGTEVPIQAACSALFDKDGKPYGGMEVIIDQTEQKGTLKEVSRLIQAAAQGQLNERAEIGNATGDYKALREGINEMLDSIVTPLNEGIEVLSASANKDLSRRVEGEYLGQMLDFKTNVNKAIENLERALTHVTEAVTQVSSASTQISTGSQSLAEGANEQASSLEEVSSSLEEMSAMTKQNADNANEAKRLADNARESADRGNESMTSMSDAINKIKNSSDETSKIVKTIDEIAFQTNLLALNAAVEAARAGEAGKGFAVVAEEVRNLAQRSAEAAKNTADMIEESVKNADGGVRITKEVADLLAEIGEGSNKVNNLISEIAAASSEQSKGIEQVNDAVTQMNKVTQQNASNSEESASAAEELNSQAEELAQMVGEFKLSTSTSDGNGNGNQNRHQPQHEAHAQAAKNVHPRWKQQPMPVTADATHHVESPDEVFPLDEDDFKDF